MKRLAASGLLAATCLASGCATSPTVDGSGVPSTDDPAVSTAPANPESTSGNATACDASRRQIAKLGPQFVDYSKGAITDADLEDAIKSARKGALDAASYSSGHVHADLGLLADRLGVLRVDLVNGDTAGQGTAIDKVTSALNRVDAACSAIGH